MKTVVSSTDFGEGEANAVSRGEVDYYDTHHFRHSPRTRGVDNSTCPVYTCPQLNKPGQGAC